MAGCKKGSLSRIPHINLQNILFAVSAESGQGRIERSYEYLEKIIQSTSGFCYESRTQQSLLVW